MEICSPAGFSAQILLRNSSAMRLFCLPILANLHCGNVVLVGCILSHFQLPRTHCRGRNSPDQPTFFSRIQAETSHLFLLVSITSVWDSRRYTFLTLAAAPPSCLSTFWVQRMSFILVVPTEELCCNLDVSASCMSSSSKGCCSWTMISSGQRFRGKPATACPVQVNFIFVGFDKYFSQMFCCWLGFPLTL